MIRTHTVSLKTGDKETGRDIKIYRGEDRSKIMIVSKRKMKPIENKSDSQSTFDHLNRASPVFNCLKEST